MDNFKYYVYNISGFKGYKYIIEKSYIRSLKNIIYDGFHVVYDLPDLIHFRMDIKIVRKIKLMKLSKEITLNSVEYKLSKLLELSKEKETGMSLFGTYGAYGTYSGSYSYSYSDSYNYDTKDEIEEKKDRNRYQSKLYNIKAKKYENKARFRK